MVDPLNYGAMLVSGSPLAQPTAGSGIPNQYQIQQFTPYSDPFATGYLNPAYQNTSKVNPGYGPNGELIDTITGRRINQFGFNNPYKTYEANVPSWMRDTAASEGMAGRYGITPAYQTALDNLKLNEYKMFLHQNDPDLMQRARRGEGYVQAYQNLAPLQVQKDVAEGRATYDQGKAYLMLHGEPGDVVRGFAGDVSNWKNQLTNAQNELQGYKKELASYGNDPQYEVQRRSLVSRIANMENELMPRWQQTLAEREEAAKGYEGALQGYAPNLGPAPYSEMATASGENAMMERDALAAYRAELEEANRQAEEASQLYKRTAGADWTEERNAALHQDVMNTRNAITDFIEATRSDAFAKGGFAVKPVWEKKRPKDLGKPKSLSVKKKKAAKARAAAAGRPYPNLVDNLAVARKKGK